MLLLLSSLALADSITLDTGVTIEGDLARYEFGGDCQVSVTEGDLTGVILIVPCHRVQSFVRTAVRTPVPIGLEEEAAKKQAEQATASAVVVEADVHEEAVTQGAEAPAVEAGPQAEPAPVREEPLREEPLRDERFYDEPLIPESPTEPIAPKAEEAPSGPIMAPMMDAPSERHRSVAF